VRIIRNGICDRVGLLKEMNKTFYFNNNCSILFTCSERREPGYTPSESVHTVYSPNIVYTCPV